MPYSTKTFLLLIILSCSLLSGCATKPDIYVNQDPGADFTAYKTYGFDANLATDKGDYGSLLTKYLTNSVGREMEARGYKPSTTPDLLVNFYVHTQEKIQTTQTPTSGYSSGYYGYRGSRYGTWGGYGGYETRVTQHTEGELNVDLVDRGRGQLVWEGSLVGRVTDKVRNNLEPAVNEAVKEIFIHYPYTAGGIPLLPAAEPEG
jgi:hypothetical protein